MKQHLYFVLNFSSNVICSSSFSSLVDGPDFPKLDMFCSYQKIITTVTQAVIVILSLQKSSAKKLGLFNAENNVLNHSSNSAEWLLLLTILKKNLNLNLYYSTSIGSLYNDSLDE